MEDEYLKESVH